MAISTKLLPRSVLAEFLPNPRAIRAFEDIQQDLINGGDFTGSVSGASIITLGPATVLAGARTLTAGAGIALDDGGAGNDLTLSVELVATSPLGYDGTTGTISIASPVPITLGGTGQTTANAALNALLPAQAGNGGKVLQTDGTNAAWQTAGGGGGSFENTPTPPVAANFTAVNGATITAITPGMFVSGPTMGGQVAFAAQTAAPPVGDFVVTARALPTAFTLNPGALAAIILRNTGTGRLVVFGDFFGGSRQLLVQRWNTVTSFNANAYLLAAPGQPLLPWKRIRKVGASLFFDISPDGFTWMQVYTETVAAWLVTVNQVGIGHTDQNNASFGSTVTSWTVL